MEAIGSISTVVGLFESAWKIKTLWDDFKDAPKEIQKIEAECKTLSHLLKGLEAYCKDNLTRLENDKSATLQHNLAMLATVMESLTEALTETKMELGKLTTNKKFDRVKFLWKKGSTFEPWLEVMEKGRANITLVHTSMMHGSWIRTGGAPLPASKPSKHNPTKTPKELEDALRIALEDDDALGLERLLEEGASTECILNSRRDRPLHYVARKGNAKALQVLLDHHVSVNELNENNATPLIAALDNHQVETALALLAWEADPHTRTRSGRTPLHYAAWGNLLKPLQRLLAVDADTNARDSEGRTPCTWQSNR
ncbi:hypothetical protein PG995_007813 [Apiospora arundinis]